MKYINLNGQKFAVDLWWQTSEASKNNALKKEARQFIKNLDSNNEIELAYNCFVSQPKTLRSKTSLIGYGNCPDFLNSKGQGVKNIGSLALLVLKASEKQTFLHKYIFEEGIWICAVLDGAIHPDGDFWGDQESANQHFNTLFQLYNTEDIVECSGVEDSYLLLDEELSSLRNTKPYLVSTDSKSPIFFMAFVVILLITITGVFTIYDRHSSAKKEELARLAKLQAAKAALSLNSKSLEAENQNFLKVWLSKPQISEVAGHCKQAMRDRNVIENGWKIKKWTCTQESVGIVWERITGGSYQLLPTGSLFDPLTPNSVVTQDLFNQVFVERENQKLLKNEEAAAKIYDLARTFKVAISITWKEPETKSIPDPGAPDKVRVIKASFRPFVYELKGLEAYPPEKFLAALNAIPGSIMNEISYDNQWILKGEIYVDL